jgi:uncharacterized protein YggU (UPF0235/DUF167 family)
VTGGLPAAPIRATPAGTAIDLRVVPRSPRTVVGGLRDGRLLVRVTAPPVDEAANEGVRRALADALDVSVASVQLTTGLRSRNKTAEVRGLAPAEVGRRLARRASR